MTLPLQIVYTKNAAKSQAEQLSRTLELLLLLLADIGRMREGHGLRLEPWKPRIEALARSPLPLREPQALAFQALRNLTRNPYADSLLREVAMSMR